MGGYKPRLLEHEKVITPGEKDELLKYISSPAVCDTRVAFCMQLVMKTGLRVSEICALQVQHCLLDLDRPMMCLGWTGRGVR